MKKTALIFYVVLGISIQTKAGKNYVIGGNIYDENRQRIRQFACAMCVFLDDGSYVAVRGSDEIVHYSNTGEKLWALRAEPHHDMSLSRDKKSILALGYEYRADNFLNPKIKTRYDVFLVIDIKSGKVLKKLSMAHYKSKYIEKFPFTIFSLVDKNPFAVEEASYELTHFNSFYEIPENPSTKIIPQLRAGDYIATDATHPESVYILDILMTSFKFAQNLAGQNACHDAQVTSDGKILFYNNRDDSFHNRGNSLKVAEPITTIDLFDPVSEKLEVLFPKERTEVEDIHEPNSVGAVTGGSLKVFPRYYKASDSQGGAQILDEGILFNITTKNRSFGVLADHKGNVLWELDSPYIDKDGTPKAFIRMKRLDLTEFLKNNKM